MSESTDLGRSDALLTAVKAVLSDESGVTSLDLVSCVTGKHTTDFSKQTDRYSCGWFLLAAYVFSLRRLPRCELLLKSPTIMRSS